MPESASHRRVHAPFASRRRVAAVLLILPGFLCLPGGSVALCAEEPAPVSAGRLLCELDVEPILTSRLQLRRLPWQVGGPKRLCLVAAGIRPGI